jgi:hypothetical protein
VAAQNGAAVPKAKVASMEATAYAWRVFRPSSRQCSTSRWAGLLGLLRIVLLAAFVTQLGGILPIGMRAVAAAADALSDDCACCDHEASSEDPADCGADCDADCGNCACTHAASALVAAPHGFSIMSFATEKSVGLGRALRAPPGPDPHSLFRPPRTQPLS